MRVKVKKTRGVTGNQHNYGLVSGSIWNYEDQPTNNTVGTTLSPVPREDANIEAERGETIVFPDSDGDVAHAKIGGKRHSEGGTPLNVPDGSFVFSDFRGLLIKNKEVLKDIFNVSGTKSKTPAEIAKKYEINSYKETLKDPWADPMDKKTAQLMIENNMKKLGQLALIQEGMKGFPDGIPDIAAPLMGSDIAQGQPIPQEQGMPMARYGGLPKAENGKTTKANNSELDRTMRLQLMEAKNKWNNAAAGSAEEKQTKQYLLNFLKANPEYAKLPSMAEFLSSDRASSYSDIGEIKKTVDKANTKKLQTAQSIFGKNLPESGLAGNMSRSGMFESAAAKAAGYKEANTAKDKEVAKEYTNLPTEVFYANMVDSGATQREFIDRMAAEAERKGLVTALPGIDDPLKRAQVEKANTLYNDAVLSGDIGKMRVAAEELKKLDISGWPTPVGTIGQIAQGIGQSIKALPYNLTQGNIESLKPSGYDQPIAVNVPWDATWQGTIYDMGDQLERRIRVKQDEISKANASDVNTKRKQDYVKKYDAVLKKTMEIINDPTSSAEDITEASDVYEQLTNTNIGRFTSFQRSILGRNPYMPQYSNDPGTQIIDSPIRQEEKINQFYNKYIGATTKDAPNLVETKTNTSTPNPYPESNYFDFKTSSYLNGATDATATVLKEQAKVNQVDKKLRDNDNIPYEEKIGNKYVQYIRTPSGKIAALFIPEPSTADVAEGETQEVKSDSSSTRNTSEVKRKDKNKAEQSDDTYTTLDEALDLWNQATQQQPQQKFGGQQQIISYDPVKRFEIGGQLNSYQKGGKFTQLIKESALKPTAEYDVIMPNKKLDYTFGTQKFDSNNNYYTAINKTTGKEEELDLNDFINRQTDVLKGYDGGIDKWKTDVLSTDKATREKASGWFQENYNTWRKANGLPEYFITKSGSNPYGKDKKLGVYTWSAPGIKKKVKADVVPPPPANTPPPPAATTPSQPGAIPAQNYEQGIAGTPWWHYDLVNYGSQLSNYFDVNPGELPTFMNYVPYVPDPTFLDPARAIAQQQGIVRGTQEAMMAGSDPTVARANMIAASAGAAPQIANIMAQYDERNAGIANQYESSRAQILNQAQLQNQQFEKQYRDELEVRRQQYENALREGRTNVAKSIMQGLKNASETSWVNATSDSYAVDPGTGQVYFKRGFDPLKGSFRSQTGSIADAYEELLNKGWSDEQARSILELQVKSKLPMNKSEAQYGGSMYNPMDLLWND